MASKRKKRSKKTESVERAVLSIRENRYFSRIWFIEGEGSDWLGGLWRDLPDGDWNLTYRWRYDNPEVDDPTGTEDEKNEYHIVYPATFTEEEVLRAVKDGIAVAAKSLQGNMHTLIVCSSNTEEVWKHVMMLPGVHHERKY